MLLLLLRENVVDLAVEISCRLDLCGFRHTKRPSSSAQIGTGERCISTERGPAHRCCEIEHGLAGDGCFFVVVLDLDVDDVHRSVQLATPVEQVYVCKVTR